MQTNFTSGSPLEDLEEDEEEFAASLEDSVSNVLHNLAQVQRLARCSEEELRDVTRLFGDARVLCLLKLYDAMMSHRNGTTHTNNSYATLATSHLEEVVQCLSRISSVGQNSPWSAAVLELRSILSHPHVTALWQAHHEICQGHTANGTSRTDSSMSRPLDQQTESRPSRVRFVRFQRNTDEAMGITLKVTPEGRCLVARILHDGLVHRLGTLFVDDEILQINGDNVTGKSVDHLQQVLRDFRGSLCLKVIPSCRTHSMQCEIYLRALFTYEPEKDKLIPCPQVGIHFQRGDILQVVSKEDPYWWQARLWHDSSSAESLPRNDPTGLIPSPELQEWRVVVEHKERTMEEARTTSCDTSCASWLLAHTPATPSVAIGCTKETSEDKSTNQDNVSRRRPISDKSSNAATPITVHPTMSQPAARASLALEQVELLTYEEVIRVPFYRRRTVVLLGAHGVGRRHVKRGLTQLDPAKYAYPLPHASVPPAVPVQSSSSARPKYIPESREEMLRGIWQHEYLEYGVHEGALYGTRLDTVRALLAQGRTVVLDVEPHTLKFLRCAEFAPFVVFIAAPPLEEMAGMYEGKDESLAKLARESEELEQRCGQWIDVRLVNDDVATTVANLSRLLDELHNSPQWVPVTWVY